METYRAKDFAAIIAATFPDYRRHEVYVEPRETVTLCDLNWSGGTKSMYRACTIDGKPMDNSRNLGGPPPWANPYEGLTVTIPRDVVLVEGGYFCGKPTKLRIYCNPANMPRLLEQTTERR